MLGYLLRTPAVTIPMALLCSFTLFGWNLAVLLPVVADKQLASGAGTFAVLAQVMAIGSLIGSVMMAASKLEGARSLAILLAVFSAAMVPLAAVNHLLAGVAVIFVVGTFGGGFLSLSNGSVQTAADPRLQGRVSAAYGVVFVGARAVGGPILGWMVDAFGSRTALDSGGSHHRGLRRTRPRGRRPQPFGHRRPRAQWRLTPPYFMRVSLIEAERASSTWISPSTSSPTNRVWGSEVDGVAHLAVHPGDGLGEHRRAGGRLLHRPAR